MYVYIKHLNGKCNETKKKKKLLNHFAPAKRISDF